MKYLILLCDGMADYKIDVLGNMTPMQKAYKPTMDKLVKDSIYGLVSNVPEGMVPESDTANLAVMSYDPKVYSKGRSPLEAVSMGLDMKETQTAFRCNVVTISEDAPSYDEAIMVDHSADEITTAEADKLIKSVDEALGDEFKRFYTGVSYRHCLLWDNAPSDYNFMRPHDIIGKCIKEYLPSGEAGKPYYELMRKSYDILKDHPVNLDRKKRGLKSANTIWLWSPGKKPALPSFKDKWGLDASVISAVDLIKGIAICAGMESIDVEGATGNVHTNYKGKADAAIGAFERGKDFVYIHVEAPDECGHRAEIDNKVLSIEKIDKEILLPIIEYFEKLGEDYKIMVLPDHPTPIVMRTHSMDPVPFFIYSSKEKKQGPCTFDEDSVSDGLKIEHGQELLSYMVEKK